MLTIISGTNARWSDEDHQTITLDLETVELGAIPFTASAAGPEQHLIDVYNMAISGNFGPISALAAPSLDALRTAAKATVDAAAEAYRLTYITPGAGQAMAYQQKLAEAKAYLADPSLTAAECPHIYAEIGITGETAEAVALVVVGMHAAWQIKSADIERKRLTAKAAVDAAETAAEISAAAAIDWTT